MGKNVHSSKSKAQKVKRKFQDRMTQSFGEDGVHIFGRIGSFMGIVALAFMVIACLMGDWSKTSQLGDPKTGVMETIGLSNITEATFGLAYYCLGTRLTGFMSKPLEDEEHPFYNVCFGYSDAFTVVEPSDSSKKNETLEGCDRFKEAEFKEADPCMRRVVVIMLMTIAIILTVIGDAVSEKPKLNGLMLTIAGGLMVFAIITWQDMQGKIESFTPMEMGNGMIVLWIATGTAFLAALFNFCDGCLCFCDSNDDDDDDGDGPAGMCDFEDDGIGYSGRAGAFMSALTWILFMCATLTPDWSHTQQLGTVGSFCSTLESTGTETGCIGEASIGLLGYCIYPLIPAYGNNAHAVCFKWDETVDTPGNDIVNVTQLRATGHERFAAYDAEEKMSTIFYFLIGAVCCVAFGDIYSEKLGMCCILNAAAAGLGTFAMMLWVSFINDIGANTKARVVFGMSGWILIGALIGAYITTLLYFKDWVINGCQKVNDDDDDDDDGSDDDDDGSDNDAAGSDTEA